LHRRALGSSDRKTNRLEALMRALKTVVATAAVLMSLSSLASPHVDDGTHGSIVHADALVWQAAEGLPEGSMLAVLFGDPAASGPLVIRVRLPADTVVKPHFHPQDEWVTVLEGEAVLGMGETMDLDAAHTFGLGDAHFLPARHPHFVKTATSTTVEIHTTGPWGITFLDEGDDAKR
jgi:quercetin dioxygenase-like cupin family protein